MSDFSAGLMLLIGVVLLAVLYFIPSISAYRHDHKSKDGILMLNLFLGWTLLGWIAAAVWASTSSTELKAIKKQDEPKQEKDIKEKLSELQQLKREGLITEDEYNEKRTTILESI